MTNKKLNLDDPGIMSISVLIFIGLIVVITQLYLFYTFNFDFEEHAITFCQEKGYDGFSDYTIKPNYGVECYKDDITNVYTDLISERTCVERNKWGDCTEREWRLVK